MKVIALDRAQVKKLDEIYKKWIREQISALSQIYGEFVMGKGYNDAAHFRHSGNSGTGMKPYFSCLPLTHKEHLRQHGVNYDRLESWEWWERQLGVHQGRFERETGLQIPEEYRVHYDS